VLAIQRRASVGWDATRDADADLVGVPSTWGEAPPDTATHPPVDASCDRTGRVPHPQDAPGFGCPSHEITQCHPTGCEQWPVNHTLTDRHTPPRGGRTTLLLKGERTVMFEAVTLLSGVVERTLNDAPGHPYSVTEYSPAGEPPAIAIVDAAIADYHQVTGRPQPTPGDLHALARSQVRGTPVTLLRESENMFGAPLIQAVEGRLFLGLNDQLGLLPKRARTEGVAISAGSILDLEAGYGATQAMRTRVEAVRSSLPQLTDLTRQDLLTLPVRAPDPAPIALAVFGTWQLPDVLSPGAIWLLHSYDPDDDIADGVLLVRPEHGYSEHGSVAGKVLPGFGGRILNPPALTLETAMDLTDLPYPQALARFVHPQPE
jgi:hypothetical protein